MFDPAPILAGERRPLARLLTQIENAAPEAETALAALFPHTGRAHLIGVTGAPGTGKSSLVNELAKALRQRQHTLAIVAVDPSSPFTGGAILGDRIRMRDLSGDPGVFIRSMASRGMLGGLARATADVVTALDAAGFEKILIETVGAGQAEVDIARTAHTTLVVEAPGLGDEVQGIKAGILEIADVLILNKADQPGAQAALRALRASLELAPAAAQAWKPPLLSTVAIQAQGVEAVLEAIEAHRAHLLATGAWQQREQERLTFELQSRLREALLADLMAGLGNGSFGEAVAQMAARETDPASAARRLIAAHRRHGHSSHPTGGD